MTVDVTVVIPTHNRASYLAEAIASVEVQRGPPTEIVVVDDASTDETPSLLEVAGPHVRRIRLDEHRERSAARNAGLAAAQGACVLFLDDDDRLADGALAVLHGALDDSAAAVAAVGGIVRVREDEVVKVGTHPARRVVRDVWPDVLLGWVGTLGRSLLRTSVLRDIGGFDEAVSYGEDWEMWLRLARRGSVVLVPEQVLHYRVHGGQSKDSDWPGAESAILQRHLDAVDPARKRVGDRVINVRRMHERGIDELRRGNARGAFAHMARAFGTMPSLYVSPLQRRRMLEPLLRAAKRSIVGGRRTA